MKNAKEQTACFTGHRYLPAGYLPQMKDLLNREIRSLIEKGVRYFGSGGALGFDTLAALSVLELKNVFPHIRLILVLPCKEQTKGWRREEVETYHRILEHADKVVYTSESYFAGVMHKRNRHLVAHSCFCICYLTKRNSGTGYTVQYAHKQGLHVTNIAEKLSPLHLCDNDMEV